MKKASVRKRVTTRKEFSFNHWQLNFRKQGFKLLEELFGPPSDERGKYIATLDVRGDVLTKNRWINAVKDADKYFVIPDDIGNYKDASFFDKGEVDFNFLWDVFVPITYRLENYSIYDDVVNLVTAELIDKSSFRFEIRNTFRSMGVSVEEYVLDFIYDWVRVDVDMTGLCAKSGIEIINKPDWWTNDAIPGSEAFHNHGDLHVVKKHDC